MAIGNHGTNGTFRIIDKATGTVKYAAQPSGGVYGGICATRTDVFFSCAKNDRGYFTYLPENGDWLMSTLSNNYGYGHSGKYTNPALDDAGNLYLAMCGGTSEKGYIACYVTEEFDDTAPVQATWSYDRSTRHRRRLRPGSRRRSICIDGEHLHVARRA